MTYELECGHCGYLFTLEGPLSRSVKCTVCGGMLTVAVAVPKTADPPPTVPPPTPGPPPKPAARPAKPAPAVDPAERASKLAEPWLTIRKGLNTARTATDFAFAPYLCLLVVALGVSPFLPLNEQGGATRLLSLLAQAHLLPAAIHLTGQFSCIGVPPTHGARSVRVSLWLLGLGFFIVLGFAVTQGGRSGILVCAVLVLFSFGFWLAFLYRLGIGLGDSKLIDESQRYGGWFVAGLFILFMLFGFAEAAKLSGSPLFVWVGHGGAGVMGFFMLFWYSILLRTAVHAIDRHAPASPS